MVFTGILPGFYLVCFEPCVSTIYCSNTVLYQSGYVGSVDSAKPHAQPKHSGHKGGSSASGHSRSGQGSNYQQGGNYQHTSGSGSTKPNTGSKRGGQQQQQHGGHKKAKQQQQTATVQPEKPQQYG